MYMYDEYVAFSLKHTLILYIIFEVRTTQVYSINIMYRVPAQTIGRIIPETCAAIAKSQA